MITTGQVIDALTAWQRANRLAVELSRYRHPGNQAQIDAAWQAEQAALNAYADVYNAYLAQGALTDDGVKLDTAIA